MLVGIPLCTSKMFIRDSSHIANVFDGRPIVVAYDEEYESAGIWYNDSGLQIYRADFWGDFDQGKLKRVETLKAGIFWCVWTN
jgi:hypothetical protein